MKKGITKKVLKIIGRLLLGILAVFLAFLIIVKIWNEIAMSHEKELLEDHPGEFVEIDGRNMNIYVEGDGDHTIVLCPVGEQNHRFMTSDHFTLNLAMIINA